MAKASGNTTTGKRGTRNEARRDTSTTSLKSDGKTMTNIVPPKLFIAGQESIVGILTISQQSTYPTWQPGNNDPDTKTPMCWVSTTARSRVLREEGTIFRKQAHKLGALQRENMVKFYMGSIARKLTRKAPCSVLLMIKPSVIRKPSQHVVVNAFESPQTKTTINSAFYFARALGIPKLTLVEEIDRSKVAALAYDDRSLRKVTLRKEKLKRQELSRVREILHHIPDTLKESIQVHLQNIFGTRGYSIGHYARVVRADLLIMNAAENRKSFLERIFPKDLEHILSELPTDVLIIQNKDNG